MSNKNIHCTLTDAELAAKADQWIDEMIASGGKSFTMRVPARPNADTDLIFSELNNRFKAKLAEYQQLKERCEKMERELRRCSLTLTVHPDYQPNSEFRDLAESINEALKEGESNTPALGEGKEAKEGLIRLILSGCAEVSKDAESAKEYLKSEGIDVNKVMEDGRYIQWKAELIKLVSEATGNSTIKLNDTEARKWYDDGATPYQTFRETWNME